MLLRETVSSLLSLVSLARPLLALVDGIELFYLEFVDVGARRVVVIIASWSGAEIIAS